MLVNFGKHKGKSVEWIVLKEPDYIKWVLDQPDPNGNLETIMTEALSLILVFDAKPIVKACHGSNCNKPAVRFTAYEGNSSSIFTWCEACDPYQTGAVHGKLRILSTYDDALHHAEFSCDGHRSDYKTIIKEIAIAKGLPRRSPETQVKAFFA